MSSLSIHTSWINGEGENAGRLPVPPISNSMAALDILFEDNHLLVVNKPPCLPTMGAEGRPTLHALACRYLAVKYAKPGRVFLGIVHRLDAMSSGVVVLARTSKAAARLSAEFRRAASGPFKVYLAVVEGRLPLPAISCTIGSSRTSAPSGWKPHRQAPQEPLKRCSRTASCGRRTAPPHARRRRWPPSAC